MFEGLTPEVIIVGAIVALFWTVVSTIVIWKFIVPYFFGRYVKETIVGMLTDPDPATRKAIGALLMEILSVPIKTGRKIKDEDGKDQEEVVTFMTYAGRELGHFLIMKLKGMRGGMTTQAGAKLEEAMGADNSLASLIGAGPRKGQSTQEYLLEQLMNRLMPMIEQKITQALNKSQNNNGF